MNIKNYQYVFLDFSLILTRSLFIISKGKKVGEYTYGDLIKVCIWTINKTLRDYGISGRKVVLLCDKWSEQLGGYYTTLILNGQYKDSRHYMTEEILENMKNTVGVTKEELEKAELELYQNTVKQTAKYTIISELHHFGVPCIYKDAWEADNLAFLVSCELYGKYELPSLLVTKDSDWTFNLSPATEYMKLPNKGEEPKIITYDEMYYSIPEKIRNCGIGLYQYKSLQDSISGSHNDMRRTRKSKVKEEKVILEVISGNYDNIEDLDLFNRQYNSFNIFNYPDIEDVRKLINEVLPVCGSLGNISDFRKFCRTHGINGISDSYYSEFIGRLDQKLYCE